ncbi:MAG: CTP synthase, partial [Clostridiales bacterium]|nr:CTP synthase [Clostridiales bacterium]
FMEAIRQIKAEVGMENCMYIHVTLVPYLSKAGELKTKPTQHSVKELRSIGIQPDIIVCRSEKPLSRDLKQKIGLFCNLEETHVVQNLDSETLYEIPLMLEEEGLDDLVVRRLNLCNGIAADMQKWRQMVYHMKNLKHSLTIGLVGKYVELRDAYLSVVEALSHSGLPNDAEVKVKWIHSEHVDVENVGKFLGDVDGILVPGGFGDRGIEGKIIATKYARENSIPYLGLCLGMQIAIIEFAQNVLGLKGANSTEIDKDTPYPVVDLMPSQENVDRLGGTMRLGTFSVKLKDDSLSKDAYGSDIIYERYRHRYTFNNRFADLLTSNGMRITGQSLDGNLAEIIELENHPWFVGVQFHPEFKSRPNNPHPLFTDFIRAALIYKNK